MKKYRSSVITLFIIVLSVFLLTKCINNEKAETSNAANSKYNEYAGSTSCITCHKNIYDTHIQTAHFHTSEIASENKHYREVLILQRINLFINNGRA